MLITLSKTAPKPFLSDTQWFLIADLFPEPRWSRSADGLGTPLPSAKKCVLWVSMAEASWKALSF